MINKYFGSIVKSFLNTNYFKFGESVLYLKRQKQAKLAKKLKQGLHPTYLEVTDTTLGGSSCGQMYKITIESQLFQGKSRVAQHQMVSDCLGEDLKKIHAFNLKTKVPKKNQQEIKKPQQPLKKDQPVAVQNEEKKQQ